MMKAAPILLLLCLLGSAVADDRVWIGRPPQVRSAVYCPYCRGGSEPHPTPRTGGARRMCDGR